MVFTEEQQLEINKLIWKALKEADEDRPHPAMKLMQLERESRLLKGETE